MLKKINWKFRKTHIAINFLGIYINDSSKGWGLNLLFIEYNLNEYSILRLTCFLPNGAERKFSYRCDFLFLREPLIKKINDLNDRRIWNSNSSSKWNTIKYKILKFLLLR